MATETRDAIVSVRGEARLECEPEIATLVVTLRCVDKDRETALARLAERQGALASILEECGPAIESRSNAGMWVHPIVKGREQKPTAYSASVPTTIVLRDISTVSDLALRCGALDDATITGPYWALRPDSSVYAQVRTLAAQQAVERARQYAVALGARLVGLLELADSGLLGNVETAPFAARALAAGAPGGADEGLVLEPQRQTVYASVEARFTMTQPVLRRPS